LIDGYDGGASGLKRTQTAAEAYRNEGESDIRSGRGLAPDRARLDWLGIMGVAGLYDIDLDRSGMAMVGLMYGLLGVLSAVGGWAALRKSRRTEK
jgi:hypothetical protein